MAESEYHVASFVVRAMPDRAASVATRIESLPGLEVHAVEDGKIIVTAEAGGARELADMARTLQDLPAVIAVAPVYHEYTGAEPTVQP